MSLVSDARDRLSYRRPDLITSRGSRSPIFQVPQTSSSDGANLPRLPSDRGDAREWDMELFHLGVSLLECRLHRRFFRVLPDYFRADRVFVGI